MGDLFFILKMGIYTLIIVVVMQVKVGPMTVEQKVIEFTHQSQLAGQLQNVAQGAAHFLGVQYNRVSSQFSSKYFSEHSADQVPGTRLQEKMKDLKKALHGEWREKKKIIKEKAEEKNLDF